MGLKLSKLLKHSYVVSEGVQTDLTIQTCDEVFDDYSFITPPRDVQHLCDPRSITRGIARTPIMCHLREDMCSPVSNNDIKKCYLETNLDEILFIDPEDPDDNIIDACQLYNQSDISSQADYFQVESDKRIICPPSPYMSTQQNSTNKNNEEISCFDNPCRSSGSIESDYNVNVEIFQTDSSIQRESSETCQGSVITSKTIDINSSEAVHQVCQEILRELLIESTEEQDTESAKGTEKEIYVDHISEITETMNRICLDSSNSPSPIMEIENKNIVSYDIPIFSPTSSKFMLKTYKTDNFEEQTYSIKNENRQPLREINGNTQSNRPIIVNKSKPLGSIENSPLKSMLPLLPSQIPLSISKTKPHLPTWDSENTLII